MTVRLLHLLPSLVKEFYEVSFKFIPQQGRECLFTPLSLYTYNVTKDIYFPIVKNWKLNLNDRLSFGRCYKIMTNYY